MTSMSMLIIIKAKTDARAQQAQTALADSKVFGVPVIAWKAVPAQVGAFFVLELADPAACRALRLGINQSVDPSDDPGFREVSRGPKPVPADLIQEDDQGDLADPDALLAYAGGLIDA